MLVIDFVVLEMLIYLSYLDGNLKEKEKREKWTDQKRNIHKDAHAPLHPAHTNNSSN